MRTSSKYNLIPNKSSQTGSSDFGFFAERFSNFGVSSETVVELGAGSGTGA